MTNCDETTELSQEEMERVQGGYSYDSAGRLQSVTDNCASRGDECTVYVMMGTPPGI